MNKATIAIVLALAAVIIAGCSLLTVLNKQSAPTLGAINTDCSAGVTCLTGSFRVMNGNMIVDTANTATSTETIGCIQTTATSTATPVHLEIGTSTSNAGYSGLGANGTVVWRYGVCPV